MNYIMFLVKSACIILILVLIYFIVLRNPYEFFGDPISIKKTPDVLDLRQQFDDVITYSNSTDGRIGFDKCIEYCNGYCVEYGLTGDAHCYPIVNNLEKDVYGNIVQNNRKLSFPNVE